MKRFYPILRSDGASVRLPVRLGRAEFFRTQSRRSGEAIWHHARRAVRTLFPPCLLSRLPASRTLKARWTSPVHRPSWAR